MKIRSGFVSNSSSSSFVIALPKSYKLSEEELKNIRNEIEDYDEYFSYYEKLAEDEGNTEIVDEREKVQKMLETGNFDDIEDVEPVNDNVKNADIKKGFEFLTTFGYFWSDEIYGDVTALYAAKAIVKVLHDNIIIASIDTNSDAGQIVNILADDYINNKGMKKVKEVFTNENS